MHSGWNSNENLDTWKGALYRILNKVEFVYKVASFANFVSFLKNGEYPSLLQRILGIRMGYENTSDWNRSINFSFINRSLVWEQFSQVALYGLPLVDWDGMRSRVSGLIQMKRADTSSSSSNVNMGSSGNLSRR